MGNYSKLDRLPEPLKTELIAKLLARESQQDISLWLLHYHGVKTSQSAVNRLAVRLQDKYAALLALGMPIAEIAKNSDLIDAIGVEAVRQQLMAKLAERAGGLFGYLDEPKATE